MKRLLSLILALLFCLSFIVSCEKEDAPSTSEPSSSSEEPDLKPPISRPAVKSMIDEKYQKYVIQDINDEFLLDLRQSQMENGLKSWTFTGFNEYAEFINECTTQGSVGVAERITSDDFENNIVYALLHNYVSPSYGRLYMTYDEYESYIMMAESIITVPQFGLDFDAPYKIDLVLVPKSALFSDNVKSIDVLWYIHRYFEQDEQRLESGVLYIPQK